MWDKIKGPGTTMWLYRESNKLKPIEIKFYEDIIEEYEKLEME